MDPPGYDEAVWERLAQVGATSTRMGASWPDIEPVRGTRDWSGVDSQVTNCLTHGITPYCLIVNTPAWASPGAMFPYFSFNRVSRRMAS